MNNAAPACPAATDVSSPFGTYSLRRRHRQLLEWAQSMPASWLGRRAALLLGRIVLSGEYPAVDAVVGGMKFRLYMRDNVSERKFLFTPQFFDRSERALMKERLHDGSVFVDIGANAGVYTMTAAALVGDTGRVLAVEPNPAVLDRLKFNAALNGFNARVTVEQSCVGDSEGEVELSLDDKNLGGASLVTERSTRRISVSCYPLMSILAKYGITRIDGLKIDIEGAEDLALMPFLAAAPESLLPGFMILENSPAQWRQDLPGALRRAGYRLLETTRMNMVWIRA